MVACVGMRLSVYRLALGLFWMVLAGFGDGRFPDDLVGTEIGGALPSWYEPSGLAWHDRLERLVGVSDTGDLWTMTLDGTDFIRHHIGGDLEAVCIPNATTDFVYVGVEQPDGIKEVNLLTGAVTRRFDLQPWMSGPANSGLEALAFVPNATHPEGGWFYAGLQCDGRIYVFSLPIASSATSTVVTHVATLTPAPGRCDLSGLYFDTATQILYALWDGSNKLRAMTADAAFLDEWDVPGDAQEGIAVASCNLIVAEDVGPEVWRYSFPQADPGDEDGDGVGNCVDLCPETQVGAPVDANGCPVEESCATDDDCDDGNPCTIDDICYKGRCLRHLVECPEGYACRLEDGLCEPVPHWLSFQEGVDGYTGTIDTFLSQRTPETGCGALPAFEWDGDEGGSGMATFGLIRFAGVFGDELDQIPGGAGILHAELSYTRFDAGDSGRLHEVLIDWDDTVTLDSFLKACSGHAGVKVEFSGIADGGLGSHAVDVTTTLQWWTEASERNFGWIILPTGDNGVQVRSSEYGIVRDRPKLTVAFVPWGCEADQGCDDGNECTIDTCTAGVCVYREDLADDDGDGVRNCRDLCPGTPVGAEVDLRGCPIQPTRTPTR